MKAIFKSIDSGISANLYVEGFRTEIWYFLPEYKFYDSNREMHTEQYHFAQNIKALINMGAINVDSWDSWNVNTTCAFKVSHLKILTDDEMFNSTNIILSCTGHQDYSDYNIQNLIIQQYTGITENVKWRHRIIGNTLSNTMAVKFFRYGFQLGFYTDDNITQSEVVVSTDYIWNSQESIK
ncbi:hypothetical protein [Chitinophaga niabensis]|uniref:Uncharacterized protein n=1 Tax=Chitinophaga niabensis TaxID=536979 RepID=A0A1N6KBI6_9BACT|nr:hypothetical protein [Chitinophaga niabensis]SIO53959.1 hypothetical protein SAMN04488055_5512 [Chitinophaga niabensis]